MSVLIFIAAVIGALVLDRQERRHRYEKRKEYERLGWDIPAQGPRLSMLESWANILLGAILSALGILFLTTMLNIPPESATLGWANLVALFLGSGFALVWLGVKAVRQNALYDSRRPPPSHSGMHR